MDIEKPDTLYCAAQPLDWRGAPHHALSALLGIDLRTGEALAAEAALAAAMSALPPGCRLDAGIPKQDAEWLLAGAVTPRTRDGSVVEIRVGRSRRRFLVMPSPEGGPVPLSWEMTAFDPAGNPLGDKRAPLVLDPALAHGAPACPLPLGPWPCRMKNMGTYDGRWLQTRWPGLPDDADWHFFNEAQPQQRLPDGLRGDEEIFLSAFGPEIPEHNIRLPGARLRLDVLRAGESDWKAHAVAADTLWLFPGEHTALLCWHALVPCADEKPSDIAAVRFRLHPETLTSPPPAPAGDLPKATPPAPAPSPVVPRPEAAAATAAAATAAGMTASTASATAAADEAAASPLPTAAEMTANLQANLAESLPEIDAALAQAGLPPLSPAQTEEVKQRLAALCAAVEEVQNTPPPPLEEQLRQAGLSEERIAAVNGALDLELPDPTLHADAASWQAASDAFLARFSSLMQPSDSLTDSMSQMLRLMGPGGDQELRALSNDLAAPPSILLQQAGMSPTHAENLLTMLDDVPDDPDALGDFAHRLEAQAGFPAGSVADRLESYQAALKQLMGDAAPAAAAGPPEMPAAAAATGTAAQMNTQINTQMSAQTVAETAAPDASVTPEAAQTRQPVPETADDGAPSSRAAVLALLAGGGSLAGLRLAGADLSDLRLDGQQLAGADLSGADLRGASLVGTDLRGAKLTGADASDASFLRAHLQKADLRGLRAVDADFSEADLAEADADEADLSSSLFRESRAPGLRAPRARMENARLRHADFSGADLSGASLRAADLHALDLDRARLGGADMTDAALGHGTRAAGADLTEAGLAGSVWTGVAAPGAVFRRASADGGSFTDCDFSAADWDAARARQADFTRCSLHGAALQRADLYEACLREARLHGADARGASLYGADLYRLGLDAHSRLDGADLSGTILAARKRQA